MSKMKLSLALAIVLCSTALLESCRRIKPTTRYLLYVPQSLYDTVDAFREKLRSRSASYAAFTEKVDSSFNRSFFSTAVFVWQEGDTFYKRRVQKENPETLEVVDITSVDTSGASLFKFFLSEKLDTITHLPYGGWVNVMESTVFSELEIMSSNRFAHWSFESKPFFRSPDSSHPIRKFVRRLDASIH